MSEWVRCTGCQLLHSRRPDGRCPRCGAPTGAPAPDAIEPLATVLVEPSGDRAAAVLAPVPRAPRVWTVFLAFLVSQAAAVALGAVVMVAVMAVMARQGRPFSPARAREEVMDPELLLAILAVSTVSSAMVALVAGWLGREPLSSRLALRVPANLGNAVAVACGGGMGLVLLFDALTTALELRPSGSLALLGRLLSAASGSDPRALRLLVLCFVLMAMVAPVAEELLFRGYIQRRLVQRWGAAAGVLVTAALFGLAHLDKLQSPFAAVIGLLLGWVTVRAGSIIPALVAHATVNGWAVVAARLHLSLRSPEVCAAAGVLGAALLGGAVWRLYAGGQVGVAAPEPGPEDPLTPA